LKAFAPNPIILVTAFDDEDEVGKVFLAPDMNKYVMPLITVTMGLERRLVTMNQGNRLPQDLIDFFNDIKSKGVEFLTFQEMVEHVEQMSKALKLNLPLSQQVSAILFLLEQKEHCPNHVVV
jgi:hypothetical protein